MKYPKISELCVLKSNTGFYIGRLYMYSEHETVPYSRESTYMHSKEITENALINNTFIPVYNFY